MEGWGHTPSQPSNFLTILHLRERWLTQNDPNQLHKHQHKLPEKEGANPPILTTSRRSTKFPAYSRAVPVTTRPFKESVDEAEPLSDEKKSKSKKKLHQKKPRSQSEHVGEPLSAVSLNECDEKKKKKSMEKHLVKKKPRSQSEDEGQALLAVSSIESEEKKKKKKSMKKKKPISRSGEVGEPLLPVSSIECDEKKKQSMKKHLMEKKARSQSEDEGEALLADPPIKSDEKKKKYKRNGRPEKPVSQSIEMDTKPPTPEENLKEEMPETECEVAKQNEKKIPEVNLKKGMRGKEREVTAQTEKKYVWARKIDGKKGVESQCGSGTVKEIENKLSRISVSFESKRGRNNGSSQGNQNIRGHRNLRRLAPRKQIDAGMIWVRKDELPIAA